MKLLIIGCGSIGRRHALSARYLNLNFALADINALRLNQVAQETKAEKRFTNIKDALNWKPDFIIVSTPHTYHISQAIQSLKSGADVLIEKPISNSLKETRKLIQYLDANTQKAYVVCNLRFHPAIRALKENLSEIGTVLYARAYYGNYLPLMRPNSDYRHLYCSKREAGGGVILDAIHEIDYLMWMLGPVTKTHCISKKISDLDINVEDFANMTLQHDNGCFSAITLDYLRPWKRRGCEIIGSEGTLIWESEGKQPERCNVRHYDLNDQSWTTLYETSDLDNGQPFIDMVQAFLKHRTDTNTILQTAHEAFDRLDVALSALNITETSLAA